MENAGAIFRKEKEPKEWLPECRLFPAFLSFGGVTGMRGKLWGELVNPNK